MPPPLHQPVHQPHLPRRRGHQQGRERPFQTPSSSNPTHRRRLHHRYRRSGAFPTSIHLSCPNLSYSYTFNYSFNITTSSIPRPNWWHRGFTCHTPLCHRCWRCPAGIQPVNQPARRRGGNRLSSPPGCPDDRRGRYSTIETERFLIYKEISLLCDISAGVPRPVVPVQFRRQVFMSVHNARTKASKRLLTRRWVWKRMQGDIFRWCKECVPCQVSKVTKHKHK